MRRIYTALFYLSLPYIALRLLWKSRHSPSLRRRWRERFGYVTPHIQGDVIWIHAVSLGETIAAIPLIHAIRKTYPHVSLIVTNTTFTGAQQIKKEFNDSVQQFFLPYDIPNAITRFIKAAQPKLLIIMETEIWPNLLHFTHSNDIPIVLANARLSQKSFRRYLYVNHFIKPFLNQITVAALQSVQDQERFLKLGLKPSKMMVTGNIKFDLHISDDLKKQTEEFKYKLNGRPVLIAASTHEGEEVLLLEAFIKLKTKLPGLLFILVPRHPERFPKLYQLCKKYSRHVVKRSKQLPWNNQTEILFGDTIGELKFLYSVSDVAFVGGSLVPVGGHNLIEPAALEVAIVTGPFLHNFTSIADLLSQANALSIVKEKGNLTDALYEIFNNQTLRQNMIEQAHMISLTNRGALQRHLDCIKSYVS